MKRGATDLRLASLRERYRLDEAQCWRLASVLDTIVADERAPTTVREPEQVAQTHLADSLVALEVEKLRQASNVADLGAGAGFPGLPLAIALPGANVRLLESQAKKCRFLRRLVAAAGVDNAHVVEGRIEELSDGAGAHDAVVARALAPQAVVLEYAAPLLELEGILVDWRGRRDAADEDGGVRAAAELGMERLEVREVRPFAQARDLHLHVFVKVAETQSRFPRRPGMARKHPLGRAASGRAGGRGERAGSREAARTGQPGTPDRRAAASTGSPDEPDRRSAGIVAQADRGSR